MIKIGYKKGNYYFCNDISVELFDKVEKLVRHNLIKGKSIKVNDTNIFLVSRETYNIINCWILKQGIKLNCMKYVILYGRYNQKEHFFKERYRECVSRTTYYRRKRVWKNPPIGVTIQ